MLEATNIGVQANDPRDNATWSKYLQSRENRHPEVTLRMRTVLSWLEDHGLRDCLLEHCKRHDLEPYHFSELFAPYIDMRVGQTLECVMC